MVRRCRHQGQGMDLQVLYIGAVRVFIDQVSQKVAL